MMLHKKERVATKTGVLYFLYSLDRFIVFLPFSHMYLNIILMEQAAASLCIRNGVRLTVYI